MEGNDLQLCPVASRKAQPIGLFDMLGNVSEWTMIRPRSLMSVNGMLAVVRFGQLRIAVRSASRFCHPRNACQGTQKSSFRVVRTLREQPLELPDGVELMIARKDLPAQLGHCIASFSANGKICLRHY